MEQIVLKERACLLAVNEPYVRYTFSNGYLVKVAITGNKIIEMRRNRLLEQKKLQAYTGILLIKNQQSIEIPIIKNSFRYGMEGRQKNVLTADIPKSVKIDQQTIEYWHVSINHKKK